MTKINPEKIVPNQDALNKASSSSKSTAKTSDASGLPSDFSRMLEAQLDTIDYGEPTDVPDSGGLPELEASFAARISRIEQISPAAPDTTGQAAAVLERLDSYSQSLADPGVSLRQARGVLDEIDLDVQKLISDTPEESDSRLKEIVNHMASLVAVEKIKMDRGDYL